MNTEEMQARSVEANRRMSEMLKELFGDIVTEEGGDGDSWYIAAIHTPNMPAGGAMTFTTLPYAEAMGASTLLSMLFSQQTQDREMSFIVRGFSDNDARRLSVVEAYRRHHAPDSPAALCCALIEDFDAAEPGEERVAIHARIVEALNVIQEAADKRVAELAEQAQGMAEGLAMSNPANWGSMPNEC